MRDKSLLAWSGGKDSALAFFEAQKRKDLHLAGLLTTLTETYDRVSMHGVRAELLERQAESLGLPLVRVRIPSDSSNQVYESRMEAVLRAWQEKGVGSVVFGDIFLADLRKHREERLGSIGMKAVFPLWGKDTAELAREFITAGFRAVITCVDSKHLAENFVGRQFDDGFLTELPEGVDPCGENGEFHSFVYDGPIFPEPLAYSRGTVVFREDRFYFCDLLPQ
jgi:uncharacterized protein (TIGR00290 family)